MIKSRQIEERIKTLNRRPASPQKQWTKRRLLSLQSSGDIKWSDNTVKKHNAAENSKKGIGAQGYFTKTMGSPRGDVELADFSNVKPLPSPRVFTPRKTIDYNIETPDKTALIKHRPSVQPPTPPRSISPLEGKIYISAATQRIMRLVIQEDLGEFPLTLSNLALCLQDKRILESVADASNDDESVLLNGLMSISLSGDESEHNVLQRQRTECYKDALKGYATGGNDKFVRSWQDIDDALSKLFLLSREGGLIEDSDEFQEEKKEDDLVVPMASISNSAASVISVDSAAVGIKAAPAPSAALSSTVARLAPTKKSFRSKILPKKAFPSPIKAKVRKSMKYLSRNRQQKKDPSDLSLDSFRKLIENKVGQKKWNQIFNRPHHLTPAPIRDAEARLDEKIKALEQSRTSKVDEILSRRKEEEQQRQAAERASSLMRPLTDEEQSIVQKALYGIGPQNEILASHEADSVQRSSLQRLQPGQWLNDEVINYFLKNCLAKRDEKLCATQPGRKRSHFFNSYFVQTMFDEKNNNLALRGKYAYKNVKRWSKKVPGKDVFNLKYIFCPINLDNMHWTSAVIFMEEKKIQYYDSLGGTDRLKLEGLLEYLKDEWRAKKGGDMDCSDWKLVDCTLDTPRQLNGECLL